MVWIGSSLKNHPVPSPPVDRDNFHQTRLFPVLGQALTFWAHMLGAGFRHCGGSLRQHLMCEMQLPETPRGPWALSCSPGQGLDMGQESWSHTVPQLSPSGAEHLGCVHRDTGTAVDAGGFINPAASKLGAVREPQNCGVSKVGKDPKVHLSAQHHPHVHH